MSTNFMVNTELIINPIQAKGSLGTLLKFFLYNSQSFWANSWKFGDLNDVKFIWHFKMFNTGKNDHVIWK